MTKSRLIAVLFYTDSVRSAEHKAIDLRLANQLDTAYNRQQARMWSQILLGCFLVLVTTVVHMFATAAVLVMLKKMGRLLHMNKASTLQRTLLVATFVACMFLVSVLDAVMWAQVYLRVGAIEHLETALYFSMVTFTTLGYGDVTLPPDWRLLASFEAANGIIMFGWTTALIAAVIQRLTPDRPGRHHDAG
jgi:predicted DNA repair protein MutK